MTWWQVTSITQPSAITTGELWRYRREFDTGYVRRLTYDAWKWHAEIARGGARVYFREGTATSLEDGKRAVVEAIRDLLREELDAAEAEVITCGEDEVPT